MVSVIEGFHCVCLKGDPVVSKQLLDDHILHSTISDCIRCSTLPFSKILYLQFSDCVTKFNEIVLDTTGAPHRRSILGCPCSIAFTVTIILPFSCRQSLSNLKRVSIVSTSFPHSLVCSRGAWNETR